MLLPRRGPEIEHPLPKWWPYAAGVLGLALCATPGLAGHASSGPLVPIAMPADTLHIAGVGIWLGGLVVLFAAFMPRADEPTLREVVPRYSQYALVAMGVIVVTGVFQAFRQIDRFGALLDTDYGRILLDQDRRVPRADGRRRGEPGRREPAVADPRGRARPAPVPVGVGAGAVAPSASWRPARRRRDGDPDPAGARWR